jgi:hypothetical protein
VELPANNFLVTFSYWLRPSAQMGRKRQSRYRLGSTVVEAKNLEEAVKVFRAGKFYTSNGWEQDHKRVTLLSIQVTP